MYLSALSGEMDESKTVLVESLIIWVSFDVSFCRAPTLRDNQSLPTGNTCSKVVGLFDKNTSLK